MVRIPCDLLLQCLKFSFFLFGFLFQVPAVLGGNLPDRLRRSGKSPGPERLFDSLNFFFQAGHRHIGVIFIHRNNVCVHCFDLRSIFRQYLVNIVRIQIAGNSPDQA